MDYKNETSSYQKERKEGKTRNLEVKMILTVDASKVDVFKTLERHVEALLDLDNWPEIKSVSGVTVK